jgi:hypothetical protein
VEGLDPFVSQNQLKGILEVFGELCYVKFPVKEGYGLVQFAHRFVCFEIHHLIFFLEFCCLRFHTVPLYFRSCAEEAIRNLNRVQIGRKGLSLSWSSSKLNRGKSYTIIFCLYFLWWYLCFPKTISSTKFSFAATQAEDK